MREVNVRWREGGVNHDPTVMGATIGRQWGQRLPPRRSEIRSTKPETNPKHKEEMFETAAPKSKWGLRLGHFFFGFGPCFGFRASDFGFLTHAFTIPHFGSVGAPSPKYFFVTAAARSTSLMLARVQSQASTSANSPS